MLKEYSKLKFALILLAFLFSMSVFANSFHHHAASETKAQHDCTLCHHIQNSKLGFSPHSSQAFKIQLIASPVIMAKLSSSFFTIPLVKRSQAPPVA